MPRLFVALQIGSQAQQLIAAEQDRLAERMRGSSPRWTKREQLHLTLVFIGEVPEEKAARVVEAMGTPLPESPFYFELGGVGAFPPRGAPRALWIGLKTGAEQLVGVQSLVAARLESIGIERERRPFSPHLTIARWRESRAADRPPPAVGEPPTIARVDADGVTLFQSRVSSAGSIYTTLVETPFGATD